MGVLNEDIYVNGTLSSKLFSAPAASITAAMIAATAGIQASKLQHEYRAIFAQVGTAASETKAVHVVTGATGTLVAFKVGCVVAPLGGATVTVDLKKNGTTVLSAIVTLNSGSTAYIVQSGTLSVTTLAAGDVLTVVTVATAGGGTLPTGVFAAATLVEDYTA